MSKTGVVQPNTTDTKQQHQHNNGVSPTIQSRQSAAPRAQRPPSQQGQAPQAQPHLTQQQQQQPILPQHARAYNLSPYTAGMSKQMDFNPSQLGYGQQAMNPYGQAPQMQQAPPQQQHSPQAEHMPGGSARKRRLQPPQQQQQSPMMPQQGVQQGLLPQPQELMTGNEGQMGQIPQQQVLPPPPKKSRTNTPWTAAEEQRLKQMREAGNNWAEIAKTFPARTEGSVKKHWYKDMHYAEFAEDESQALLNAIKEYETNKWKVIGQKVGKPAKACEQYAKEHFGTPAKA